MQQRAALLLIEDDEAQAALVTEHLRLGSEEPTFEVDVCTTLEEAVAAARRDQHDACLLDLGLPDSEGLDAVVALRTAAPRLPIVVLTGRDETLALRALRVGAQDYLSKDHIEPTSLVRSIRYAMERHSILERLDARVRARRDAHEELLLDALAPQRTTIDLDTGDHGPLRERRPVLFEALVEQCAGLLTTASELVLDRPLETLEALTSRLVELEADSHDALDLYRSARTRVLAEEDIGDPLEWGEGSRAVLVELLAHLANAYRASLLRVEVEHTM